MVFPEGENIHKMKGLTYNHEQTELKCTSFNYLIDVVISFTDLLLITFNDKHHSKNV